MKLIILNSGSRQARTLNLAGVGAWVTASIAFALVGAAGFAGYSFAVNQSNGGAAAADIDALRADLQTQRATLDALQTEAEEQIGALALRMGELNANVIRLNALGVRLTGIADLDEG